MPRLRSPELRARQVHAPTLHPVISSHFSWSHGAYLPREEWKKQLCKSQI
jgi:hypothetical protein